MVVLGGLATSANRCGTPDDDEIAHMPPPRSERRGWVTSGRFPARECSGRGDGAQQQHQSDLKQIARRARTPVWFCSARWGFNSGGGCSQHPSTPVDAGRRHRETPAASSAASTPAHIGHNTCEEVAAGRLVWEVDSGSGAGSGVAAPRAAPWARGGIAHRPVLGDLELGHAHSFGMRHVM
jgi:hypothetical protein